MQPKAVEITRVRKNGIRKRLSRVGKKKCLYWQMRLRDRDMLSDEDVAHESKAKGYREIAWSDLLKETVNVVAMETNDLLSNCFRWLLGERIFYLWYRKL